MASDDTKTGAPKGVPVCSQCGQPVDGLEGKSEQDLLDVIRKGLLRDLARKIEGGSASHQELAIARGMLRDNSSKARGKDNPLDSDEDEALPEQQPQRQFPKNYPGED